MGIAAHDERIIVSSTKEIPFRPKLEGDFRTKFYKAVSVISDITKRDEIEKIAQKEISWVEKDCNYNLKQRKKYRAVWMFFCDLLKSSWTANYRQGVLYMRPPDFEGKNDREDSWSKIKEEQRGWMRESRLERLLYFSDFIKRIERKNAANHSIEDLIADGNELATRLEKVNKGEIPLLDAVKPYLQLVEEGERDEYTGLKISEIWRYFRLTWSTPSETTPGRTMQYLIRDAAHPTHAVMGIASLENCIIQITCRDDYIGWTAKTFRDRIEKLGKNEKKQEFARLLDFINAGIAGIDHNPLCTEEVINAPKEEDIQNLRNKSHAAEEERQSFLKETFGSTIEHENKSDLGNISKKTEESLYVRKKADWLAKFLDAKKTLLEKYNSSNFENGLIDFCDSAIGKQAIRTALMAQKAQHIGSSLMELNVCGAIPPYNEILGGKLVALLATSPKVIHDYKERYRRQISMIASRLKGKDVIRPADLVYIGTTSLYSVGSSQYNRLKIPGDVFGRNFDVVWKKLGETKGFGTLHISKSTTCSLVEATEEDFSRINHVFGEGTSPKLRLLTMAIRELLESSGEDSKEFSKHAMNRIVYGACLAQNTLEYLMGKETTPKYYTNTENYNSETQKIIDFWKTRWLRSRLNYQPIYQKIREFNRKNFLVGNQITTANDSYKFMKLKEDNPILEKIKKGTDQSDLNFIRNFYRGTSAYADHADESQLQSIHVPTKLDDAIKQSVKNGKDVVLTGNPGDGKTHIIRILKSDPNSPLRSASVELDASTLSNAQIIDKWSEAKKTNKPFVIAINAAVLYSLNQEYSSKFSPVKEASEQMVNSVVFNDSATKEIENKSVILFDLSKRDVLTKEILSSVIKQLVNEKHYGKCSICPIKGDCPVKENRVLLQNSLFQERLTMILKRVSIKGYHATLRELQSFISYLIFGNRSCEQLCDTIGKEKYGIVNLIYSGKGKLFEEIKTTLDPSIISHPEWDEKILKPDDIEESTWKFNGNPPIGAIDCYNEKERERFKMRKREFFFFNEDGKVLIDILNDNLTKFIRLLESTDGEIIKDLISKLNCFFGESQSTNDKFRIWTGHRYNNDPRKVLISLGYVRRSEFSIGRPKLTNRMDSWIDMQDNYIRFEKKNSPEIFLKIDFNMYRILIEAERGVPILFIESDQAKNVWRFSEKLMSQSIGIETDPITVSLMDIQNKQIIDLTIDSEGGEKKYATLEIKKIR